MRFGGIWGHFWGLRDILGDSELLWRGLGLIWRKMGIFEGSRGWFGGTFGDGFRIILEVGLGLFWGSLGQFGVQF